MRRLLPTAALGLCLALSAPGSAEPLSKPLRAAVPAKAGSTVVVENLAGRLEVVRGGGAEAVLAGTARCDAGPATASQALLDAVAIRVREAAGAVTLHVDYPVEKSPFRYEKEGRSGSAWNRSSSTVEYQGRQVTVREGGSAPLLQADLTLEVPEGVAVRVVNHVGRVAARDLGGALEVKTAAADVSLEAIAGAAEVRTGSGDVRVRGAGGLDVQTGSGDVDAERASGTVSVRTGSGDVRLGRSESARVSVRTGSGDVALDGAAGDLELHTGSGDVRGSAVARVSRLEIGTGSGDVSLSVETADFEGGTVETASGDVALSLVSGPAMRLSVSTASGDIDTEGLQVTRLEKRGERSLVADVRGGGPLLRVSTASGSVRVR